MKYSLISIAIFLVLLAAGCKNTSKKNVTIGDECEQRFPETVSIDISDAVGMDEILQNKQFVELTEDTEHILGYIHNAVVRGDTIFAIDAYKAPGIYAYLTNGEQLFAYCHVGQGPGDIVSPSCLSVTDNEISTFDTQSSKIVVINKKGEYIRSIDVPIMSLNAILDGNGDVWADFTNQDFDNARVSWKAETDSNYQVVLEVPEILKGVTVIEIESLQNINDSTVGYLPVMEPRIYSLSNGKATVRYELDFNGLWPDDKTMKEKFSGNTFAPMRKYFPIQGWRFHESNKYLVLGFKNNKHHYLCFHNKLTNKDVTVSLNEDDYSYSCYVKDTDLYLCRKDDRIEIMTIKEFE